MTENIRGRKIPPFLFKNPAASYIWEKRHQLFTEETKELYTINAKHAEKSGGRKRHNL